MNRDECLTNSLKCTETLGNSSCRLASPVPISRPIKRGARACTENGGAKKRRCVVTLRVVSKAEMPGLTCQEKSNIDTQNAVDVKFPTKPAWPKRYSEVMECLERLCARLDVTEPAGAQGSGPHARNPEIKFSWHMQLVGWMLHFTRGADVQNSTIAVAVVFLQKFMTDRKVSKEWFQLLGMVCTFVASKVHENRGQKPITMRFLTQSVANGRYSKADIKRCEHEVLGILNFKLHPVTAHELTMVILELHPNKSERAEMLKVANVLLDMQLANTSFLKWSTKMIALGCFSATCAITGFTAGHKAILSQMSHLVDEETMVEGKKVGVILRKMFYKIFPEREHTGAAEKRSSSLASIGDPEKRSFSPDSIMDPIATKS